MVLKLCGGLWPSGRADDDVDARQRRMEELLNDSRLPPSPRRKFAKEVSVKFTSNRPMGLSFMEATPADAAYKCVVQSVDGGQVADHNARNKARGDYSQVILQGMSVRCVDGEDVRWVSFLDVVHMIHRMDGGSVTFADTASASASPKPKLRTVGNIVVASQRVKKQVPTKASPSSTAPLSPSSRRSAANANSSPKISKWSSVLTAVTESQARGQQADALASDLSHKSSHLEAQVLMLKARVATLERERDQASQSSLSETESLLQTIKTERETAEAKLLPLAEATAKCGALQQENAALREDVATREAAMDSLQHAVDVATLQISELRAEHDDVQHHAEELHSRLVSTQLRNHEMDEELKSLQQQRQAEAIAVRAIEASIATGRERRASSASASTVVVDDVNASAVVVLLQRIVRERMQLHAKQDELQIELSCHEATVHTQSERLLELEDKLGAVQQINASLKEQLLVHTSQPLASTVQSPRVDVANSSVLQQLEAERKTRQQLEQALQALEDKARGKLQVYEKEQLFLAQFKEQLTKGITVTKYGSRGNPHPRVLYTDPQCRWLSWHSVDVANNAVASSPRADAKVETMDLVEVLHGATTETFQLKKPDVPARCLSLVACHPCRTLDVEVENRDRALFLLRGFRLLLEEATEKRRQLETF